MLLKRFIEYVADQFGLIVIPKWRFDKILLVRRLNRIISEYAIDCILDVGANIGQYRHFLRNEVGYDGLIISFEPDPKCYEALKEAQVSDGRWVIKEYALGKERSHLNLNIMNLSVFNSFLEPDNNETSQFKEPNTVTETITVEVNRLDDVITDLQEAYGFKNIFLKMDTQGFDLDVFEGAHGCLDRIRGIQTEISVMPIYKNMPTFDDSLRAFKSKGFEVSGLYSLSEARFPHAVEFDCIYLPK